MLKPRMREVAATAPRYTWFNRASLAFLSAAALVGVFLRTKYVFPHFLDSLKFGNLLHAHSHTMFFGWVTLALCGAIYRELARLRGAPLAGRRLVPLQWWGTVLASAGALVSFSVSGYSPLSIVFATINMVLWYTAVAVIWRNTPEDRPVWAGFYHAAAFYLALSTFGTWLLTVLQVTGHAGTPLWSTAPVYFYLSNFIDGWAVLGVTGLLYQMAAPLPTDRGYSLPLAERQLRWQAALTLPAYLHYLSGLQLPLVLRLAGAAATALLLLPALMMAYNLRGLFRPMSDKDARRAGGPITLLLLRSAVVYFLVKAVGEAVSVLPGLDRLVYGAGGRQWVVLGLHVTLFGVVSLALMAERARQVHSGNALQTATSGVLVGLAAMLAFLLVVAAGPVVPALAAHYRLWFEGAWLASLLLWASVTAFSALTWRERALRLIERG